MTAQVPPTTTLPSSSTAATATTWNSTQQHTIAEYFFKYNMETIPESLNGELSPLSSSSHGSSRSHTYNHTSNNQNLHVPKRSNTYTVSTSTSSPNRHQRYAHAGASAENQSPSQQQSSSSLNRSFSSPLSPQSDTSLGSRMIGGSKSTKRVREWVKRSNSSRTELKPKPGRSSSNSGHQTLEIIHLGGGRLESNGHIHSASLSSNFLAPSSHQNRSSRANSIDSRVTQWSDLYHDPPESLTVITKPATATGKPSRPVSPELHERPQLQDLYVGSSHAYGGNSGRGQERERDSQGHRHTKSDGSIHPAPLRIPSNSSSSSSIDKKDGGAAVITKPEETWKPQGPGVTRSNSKWKPLPVPPPPGAPGSVTPLVDSNGSSEDNINMSGAIGVSPLTSVDMSESEFGEREDTPRTHQQQAYGQSVHGQGHRSGSRKPSPSDSNDASALGIGYAVGLGVLSPPLTPPEQNERDAIADQEPKGATTCTYGIRESIWPVPPSYASSQPRGAPPQLATASPEQQRQRQHQHSQKPSTSSSLASTSTLASSQSVPTHIIPKRSDSLSYSRNRRPQHAPQSSTSTSASSRSTDKASGSGSGSQSSPGETAVATASTAFFAHGVATRIDKSSPTVVTKTQAVPQLQTPTVTPPTPIVTLPTPPLLTHTPSVPSTACAPTPPIPTRAVQTPPVPAPTVPTPPLPISTPSLPVQTPLPEPKTPTWSPRNYLSSKEMLWLHRNYRGLTTFFSSWGLHKGLIDEAEREEGLNIMRELMAAEVENSHKAKVGGKHQTDNDMEGDDSNGLEGGGNGGEHGDKSWLDFSPGPGDKRNTKTETNEDEKGERREEEGE